ncbi:hypothetical protein HID58_054891, partial [Brassica napus]
VQDQLKNKYIAWDDFPWKCGQELLQGRYFRGRCLSLPSRATSLRVIHHDYSPLCFHVPYVHGFLDFREFLFSFFILKKRRDDKHPFYSQVSSYRWLSLNHASVFFKKSLALLSLNTNTSYTRCSCSPSYHWVVCLHLHLIINVECMHHVDGLNQYEVRRSFQTKENQEQVITLLRNSGFTFQQGFRPTMSSLKLLYVSVGPHRIYVLFAWIRLGQKCYIFKTKKCRQSTRVRSI